jgi:TrmH family RNA methyltransferase
MFFDGLSKNQVKLINALKDSSIRRKKTHSFFVEGLKTVIEAISSDYSIEFIVASDKFLRNQGNILLQALNEKEIKVFRISQELYSKLSDTISPQGLMAIVKSKIYDGSILFKKSCLTVALDRIGDPGNMGTIIRTADAAGASGLILSKGCVDVYNPKVIRSTMGSIFHLPFVQTDDLVQTLNEFKRNNGRVVTTHLKANKYYFNVDYTVPTVIVMGQEDEGVLEEIVNISDELIQIPMPGSAESLNVAIASGIILFEAVKQRIMASPSACK